jgi:hypothetical protein
MADQRAPEHDDDPRGQDTGQGYPETNPAGSTPGADGTAEGPESGDGGADAPSQSREEDSGRDTSTGNPDAAG